MNDVTLNKSPLSTASLQIGVVSNVSPNCKPGRFYVYTHRDKNGTIFYVGKGTGERAHSRDRSPEWLEYLETKSDGIFFVEIIRDGISEDDALEIENFIMKMHGETIVNRVNPYAPHDAVKFKAYCEAQNDFDESLMRATNFKKSKEFDNAISEFESAYTSHLVMVKNSDYDLGARRGLKTTGFAYHPQSKLADGYSMVLVKSGRNSELIAFAERYFRDYGPPYNIAEENLRKRMEKARAQQ